MGSDRAICLPCPFSSLRLQEEGWRGRGKGSVPGGCRLCLIPRTRAMLWASGSCFGIVSGRNLLVLGEGRGVVAESPARY